MSVSSTLKKLGLLMFVVGLFYSLSVTNEKDQRKYSPTLISEHGQLTGGQGRSGITERKEPDPSAVPNSSHEQDPNTNLNWEDMFTEQVEESNGRLNLLLLGIDGRDKELSRSDSIVLVSLNPKDHSAAILSILRDTYVNIPAPKPLKNRINVAYTLGGPELVLKTVSSFLQVPIKYYVVADFQGFAQAVDAIGGIELDVEKRMDYVDDGKYDIHLKPGTQTLDGNQALGYARFRHDARGDYARVERQRKVLKAMLEKIQGVQAVYYLPKILDAVKPYINTNLDFSGLANLAYLGYMVKSVDSHSVPSEMAHTATMLNGMAVLVPNLTKTRSEVKNYLAVGED